MFTNGHAYDYYDVPEFVWEGLRKAPSAGAFINTIIKKLNFNFTKV